MNEALLIVCRPLHSLLTINLWLLQFNIVNDPFNAQPRYQHFYSCITDPYELVWQTQNVTADKCNNNCHPDADCACGLVYGDYKCACPKGYSGSGYIYVDQCFRK